MADRRLRVFYTVARHLSFTKAADVLFMTQPAVTFQVKQLEEHFNARLFERSPGKISLTPAGRLVLSYAEKILAMSEEMENTVAAIYRYPVKGLSPEKLDRTTLAPGDCLDFGVDRPLVFKALGRAGCRYLLVTSPA